MYAVFEGTDAYPPDATFTLVTVFGVSNVATQIEYNLTDDPVTVGYGSVFSGSTGRNIEETTLSGLSASQTKIKARIRSTDNTNSVTVWHAYIKVESIPQ